MPMILSRYGTFTGGIDLPDEKYHTISRAICKCPAPAFLRVPLAPCGGAPGEPVVHVGQRVSAGERIAAARDASGVDVFAPLDGTVRALTTAAVAGKGGLVVGPAVMLTELSEPRDIPPARETFNWRAAGPELLRSRIAAGGLSTYGERPEPLAQWLLKARQGRCKVLIANVMEGQPYVTAAHRLMVEYGREVLRGLAMLARAIEARKVFLVADRRRTGDYRCSARAGEPLGIQRVALPHKYPTEADAILVKILTRREVPPDGGAMDVGAAVIGAAACFAVFRQVACGQPPTGRVVTVSGERASQAGNFYVPFGMSCLELAGDAASAVIHGGPMTGLRCDEDVVVGLATNAVLAGDPGAPPVAGPCVRCGWCTDHCPMRLNVAILNDAFELADIERAERLTAMACVECGVCSYVCPARLPLTRRMKQLKQAIRSREFATLAEAPEGAVNADEPR